MSIDGHSPNFFLWLSEPNEHHIYQQLFSSPKFRTTGYVCRAFILDFLYTSNQDRDAKKMTRMTPACAVWRSKWLMCSWSYWLTVATHLYQDHIFFRLRAPIVWRLSNIYKQESPAVAKKDALQPIQFLLQYGLLCSSKVDNFHLIWKGIWDFLLVINSNLGPISHCFWDMTNFPLKNTHFSYPFHSTLNLKMLPLHCIPQILYTESLDTKLIIRVKFSSSTQRLATIHLLHTDRKTDRQTTTVL